MFTGRFGPNKGEVLFDRICRENGIRHLLTAPRSPTTTGKVERFHKTVRHEFLEDRVFGSAEEAQAELDRWVVFYNASRPHQGIGMDTPSRRFSFAQEGSLGPVALPSLEGAEVPREPEGEGRRVTRRVGSRGSITLADFRYHVGGWLAGETVHVLIRDDGLVDIFHREVLVASHARRHRIEKEPAAWQLQPRARPATPETAGVPVVRKVDGSGNISFAGTSYRVGNLHRLEQVEVRVVGDTVQISTDGRIIRTHRATHDPQKEHGALANPGGRPRRSNAAS